MIDHKVLASHFLALSNALAAAPTSADIDWSQVLQIVLTILAQLAPLLKKTT